MQTVCTIITAGYLPLAKVLHASLQKQLPGTSLQVLVVEENNFLSTGDLIIHSVAALADSPYYKGIQKKYGHTNADYFRWALKPVFMGYLLEKGFTKVLFADPDLYFVGNFEFLFSELDKKNVLLTPHWATIDPLENEDSLLAVLKGGLYNAGFVGVSKNGADAMNWWAGLCHYKTEDLTGLGLFVDQKYLDILPVQFENVEVIKHRGCNLASWNIDTSRREIINGQLMINKTFEPVFIHFAKDTITNILNKNDALLRPWLDEYIAALKLENFDLLKNLDNYEPGIYSSPLYKIKHRLRIRTRLKRFLFRFAEKL
ncbi:MAG: hypothetical protein H7Y01_04395 [Ferruginibacter sp.]|nr:hypothetical protein [Chitinophagaceae bacterium]